MKNKSTVISLIIFLSILALCLASFLIIMLNNESISNKFKEFFTGKDYVLIDSIEKDYEEINGIKLDLLSTDVVIKESEDKVLVEYYSNQDKNASLDYSKGYIKLDENDLNTICVGICNVRRRVVIYLPKNYSKELVLIGKSADITSLIDLDNADINLMSGDVLINNIKKASIKTTSGDIKIDSIKEGTIKTTSGDVNINEIEEKITIDSTSGDITIYKSNIKENSYISSTSGDVKIVSNESNIYVDAHSTSGDLKVNKSDRKSDIIFKITTTSGDIFVN